MALYRLKSDPNVIVDAIFIDPRGVSSHVKKCDDVAIWVSKWPKYYFAIYTIDIQQGERPHIEIYERHNREVGSAWTFPLDDEFWLVKPQMDVDDFISVNPKTFQMLYEPTFALSEQVGGNHYKGMAIQPVEFIHQNGIGFVAGNCIKYLCRYKNKNGVEDLKKARHYLDMLIEMEEKGQSKWSPITDAEIESMMIPPIGGAK